MCMLSSYRGNLKEYHNQTDGLDGGDLGILRNITVNFDSTIILLV